LEVDLGTFREFTNFHTYRAPTTLLLNLVPRYRVKPSKLGDHDPGRLAGRLLLVWGAFEQSHVLSGVKYSSGPSWSPLVRVERATCLNP
jgi:hypothetical protein